MAITKTYPLPALSDVADELDPHNGDVLTWNNTEWIAAQGGIGDATLSDLTDVTATTPAPGEVLTFDGSQWGPSAPAAGYSDEQAQDATAAALAAGTHSGISVAYTDAGNALSLTNTVTPYTAEQARDDIGAALVAGSGITITPNDPGDTITIASTVGASSSTGAALPWIPGRYYDTGAVIAGGGFSSNFIGTGKLFFQPLYVPFPTPVDRAGVYVTSAGTAGQRARIGLYTVGSTGWPGTLEWETGAVLTTDAIGPQQATISRTLATGWHYIVLSFSLGTVQISAWGSVTALQAFGQGNLTNTAVEGPCYSITFTDAALPSTFPALTGLTTVAGILRLALRAA